MASAPRADSDKAAWRKVEGSDVGDVLGSTLEQRFGA